MEAMVIFAYGSVHIIVDISIPACSKNPRSL